MVGDLVVTDLRLVGYEPTGFAVLGSSIVDRRGAMGIGKEAGKEVPVGRKYKAAKFSRLIGHGDFVSGDQNGRNDPTKIS